MTRKDYLEQNLNKYSIFIDQNINFSHVKLGDGEIFCMRDIKGENVDKHPYSTELSDNIKLSLIDLSNRFNVFIADWFYSNPPRYVHDFENQRYLGHFQYLNRINLNLIQPFELLMLGWCNLEYDYLFKFYQKIKQSKRKKTYICNEKFSVLKNVLNIDKFINIPLINAYNDYNKILTEAKDNIIDNDIILLSVGMMSPVLINDILKFNENVTILDIGSGLDALVLNYKNRGESQASHEEALNYFKNI
jgi:hypothetical protein